MVHPADEQDAADVLLVAHDAQEAVVPVGGATMLEVGDVPSRYDVAVVTDRITGIVEYNPGDLTIVVRAGTTLAEVDGELRRHNQFLSLQAPHPESATVGGALASNSSGPLRVAYGSARDAVIGTRVALPNGQIARSGGRVVKNVAGYDLSKLFIGSYGTLGIIVEAAFKVYPRHKSSRVLVVPALDMPAAMTLSASLAGLGPGLLSIAIVNARLGQSIQLEGPSIVLLVGGTREATDEMVAETNSLTISAGARSLEGSDGDHLMDEIRDFPGRATVRLSGRSELPHAVVAASDEVEALLYPTIGTSYVYAPRWAAEDVAAVRREMAQEGGRVIIWHGSPALDGVSTWGEVGPELSLMRVVKTVFDPQRIMSPGRFVGDI